MRRYLLLTAIAFLLAACQSVPKDYVQFHAGLDASTMDVTSLGEADLLIKTPDETPEPRNRRVEIAVR